LSGSNIPQIILIDKKGKHRGIQGSYCWNGICVDYEKPSSRIKDIQEQLSIPKDSTITFEVVDHIKPEQLHVSVFSDDQIVLHEAVKMKMKIKISRGTYFFNLKATWEGKGDVSNVFLVKVL
jgi:hypothetical protein